MQISKKIGAVALASAMLLSTMPAFADMSMFKADLTAAQETPPTVSKGTGTVMITYDSATKTLSWKGSYDGLTGPATAAHFHGPAEMGKAAGVEVPVPNIKSPFEGSAVLTEMQAGDLMSGKLYFNVHTEANKGGEVRGQVMPAK